MPYRKLTRSSSTAEKKVDTPRQKKQNTLNLRENAHASDPRSAIATGLSGVGRVVNTTASRSGGGHV